MEIGLLNFDDEFDPKKMSGITENYIPLVNINIDRDFTNKE